MRAARNLKNITVKATVSVPTTPNFLKMGERWLPLCAISEESLRELGQAWVEALVEKQKKQAKDADHFYKVAGAK